MLLRLPYRHERERERNNDVREKRRSVASCLCPDWGTEPATQAWALTGNRPGDTLLCGAMPNQLSHTGPGSIPFFF